MLGLKKVAVTGDLASGKTTVCSLLEQFGATVVNSDQIVHQILSCNLSIRSKLVALLGDEVMSGGSLDRTKIAQKVFSRLDLLRSLESLLHPLVRERIELAYDEACRSSEAMLFVAEVPLLFEMGYEADFDAVIYVTATPGRLLERFLARGGEEEQFHLRRQRLIATEEKQQKATFLIQNDGEKSELYRKVYALFLRLVERQEW